MQRSPLTGAAVAALTLTLAAAAAPSSATDTANAAPRAPGAPAAMSLAADLEALKSQLAALQARLAELEASQQAAAQTVQQTAERTETLAQASTEQQEAIDRGADNLARALGESAASGWVARWQWRGDFRYRNETIDQQYATATRNRDRIRARFGAMARVNDTMRVELQLATTEGADARSSNQSLSDVNSRKPIELDVAYMEWMPAEAWRITAGKMRYPWVRTSSFFFDNDINPEGFAASWQQGANGFFGSAFVTRLAERATFADSSMQGVQGGYRNVYGDGGRVLVAASYYDHSAVQGYNAIQAGSAGGYFGNSTGSGAAVCRTGVVGATGTCLADDFDVVELLGEWQFKLADRPLLLYANLARNTAAKFQAQGLDTAYAVGFNYGRAAASIPGTWEFGYLYQKVEKDALFAQWIDSDFAAGGTDGGGSAFRVAYQLSPNARVNVSYLMTETNLDVPVAVTVPVPATVRSRDYDRLQVDVNWTF
jgi:hypothetical protein